MALSVMLGMTYRLVMPLSTCTTVAQKTVESYDGTAIEVFILNPEQEGLKLEFPFLRQT